MVRLSALKFSPGSMLSYSTMSAAMSSRTDQRAAFKAFVEKGGGFVGIHAAGGDFSYAWDWYINALIGAQFIGHPMDPQFQKATVRVEDKTHPATAGLPDADEADRRMVFVRQIGSRPKGYNVLLTLDESELQPEGHVGAAISPWARITRLPGGIAGQGSRILYRAGPLGESLC